MKSWIHSKTIWFNVATMSVQLAGVGLLYLDRLGLDPQQAMSVAIALTGLQTAGNLYLRTVTRTGIK
jgi:hypothetical protein